MPTWMYWSIFCIITAIYIALRYIPISQETVPYTYDQGRDFLAARNIVVNKDITLIGPTTGAEGVFHGAWWYYFLAIPFTIFNGDPIGFYYFIALVGVLQGVAMAVLIKKEVSPLLSLMFLAIVSISPYFIKTSIFAINSILTLPCILILLVGLYGFIKKNQLRYLFLTALSAGLIAEAEVAFGIFLFPSLVLAVIISKNAKLFFGSIKKTASIISGVTLAMSLRILFELKYNFLQTKALTSFWGKENTQPKEFSHVIKERLELFWEYYMEIFPKELKFLGIILLIVAVVGYWKGYRKLEAYQKKWISFVGLLTVLLYVVSLIYKNSFFWAYYFEGIHYIFIVLVGFGLYCLYLSFQNAHVRLGILTLLVCTVIGGMHVRVANNPPKSEPMGLLMHKNAIEYLYTEVGMEPFCLRMYTPPVLTHTYNYLLDQQSRTGKGTYPRTEFIDNQCWYFVESDSYALRRTNWLLNNIPEGATKEIDYSVSKDLSIQKWVMKDAPVEK